MLRALFLGLGLSFVALSAQASVVVNFSFTLDSGPGGAAETYSGSFRLSGAPVYWLEAGETFDSDKLASDYIGYTLSDFTPITVGGATFEAAHILPRIPVPGFAAAVWFDAEPVIGASPTMWLHLDNGSQSLALGGGFCLDTGCSILPIVDLDDGVDWYRGTLTTSVMAVPLPATLPLIAAGLAGLALPRRRRPRSA